MNTNADPKDDQEREILTYLQEHARVTVHDVSANTSASEWKRTNFMSRLRKAGILMHCGMQGPRKLFTVHDTQAVALDAEEKRATPEGKIWQAMRVLRTFTPLDLRMSSHGGSDRPDLKKVQTFCSLLLRAKYLVVINKAVSDVSPATYKLVKDTGPLPPIERRIRAVVDQNDDIIVYAGGERL